MKIIKNTIKSKLRSSFLLFVLLSCTGGAISFYLLNQVIAYSDLSKAGQELSKHLMQARKAEADFLNFDIKTVEFHENGTSFALYEFDKEMRKADSLLHFISNSNYFQQGSLALLYPEIKRLSTILSSYNTTFNEITKKYKTRGFKDYGLEGDIREHVHKLQECKTDEEKVIALTLRKHEKDYFIRNDLKYVDKLSITAEKFKQLLVSTYGSNDSYTIEHSATIDAYVKGFKKIVKIEQEIGLDKEKGLLAKMDKEVSDILPRLNHLSNTIQNKYDAIRYRTFATLAITTVALLLLGLWFSLRLSKNIASPISMLTEEVVAYMKGERQKKSLELNNHISDEVKSLSQNFNELMNRTDKNMSEISEKNVELEERAKEEGLRRWVNEGIAKVSDITRQVNEIDNLSHDVIVTLVKLTGSNQGALFTVDKDEQGEEYLEMKGCYAYNRKKYLQKRIYTGEGLVGAAFYEKDVIYMQELPEDYVNITSGLGDATPRNVFIVPIMDENKVEGVIELASFQIYEEHQKELVLKVAERLCSVIGNLRNKEETERLLKESQMMTENLRASEEELRQNFEELEATQEELNRLSRESEQKLELVNQDKIFIEEALLTDYSGILVFDATGNIVLSKYEKYIDATMIESKVRHLLESMPIGSNKLKENGLEITVERTKKKGVSYQTVLFCLDTVLV